MKIGVIASGVGTTTTINLQFLPQFLHWVNATVPQAIKVIVEGDGVIMDLDSNGINALNLQGSIGAVTNGFTLPLSNGFVPRKNVDIVVTNGVAANIDLYGYSVNNKGSIYLQSIQQTVLANSGTTFEKFGYLALPSLTTSDVINVEFNDGLVQRFEQPELKAMLQYSQNVVNGATNLAFDNYGAKFKSVQLTPAAQQKAYICRYSTVGNVSQSV